MINDEYILSERDVELIKFALEKTISIVKKETSEDVRVCGSLQYNEYQYTKV